jgi:hypothetical protein
MIKGLQLPFRFDPQLLKADLEGIQPDEWTPHYNERDYGGDWHGIALRSLSGDPRQLFAKQSGADAYADTAVLRRSPYFREVLSVFACPLKSVRLLRLGSGSVIREHSDPALGFEEGEVRIHIPIKTSAAAEFCLAGEALRFEEGNCYYVNVSLPHRVSNRGSEDRIHLVIDADVNDWVRSVFRKGQSVASVPHSSKTKTRWQLRGSGYIRKQSKRMSPKPAAIDFSQEKIIPTGQKPSSESRSYSPSTICSTTHLSQRST